VDFRLRTAPLHYLVGKRLQLDIHWTNNRNYCARRTGTRRCFVLLRRNEVIPTKSLHFHDCSSYRSFVRYTRHRACSKRLLLRHHLIHTRFPRCRYGTPRVVLVVDRGLYSISLRPWCQHRRERHRRDVDSCERPSRCVNTRQYLSLYHCIPVGPARLVRDL